MRLLIRIPCPWLLRRHQWTLDLSKHQMRLTCPHCGAKTSGWDLRLPLNFIRIAWPTSTPPSVTQRSALAN